MKIDNLSTYISLDGKNIILSLNVTTSGRNCNTIFDVLTSKMSNADRSKHASVCVCNFVLIKLEHQNKYERENCKIWPVIL